MKDIAIITVKNKLEVICSTEDLLCLLDDHMGAEVASLVRSELNAKDKEITELERAVAELEEDVSFLRSI